MPDQDYYRLLGVSRDAPERMVKKAYYEMARKLHPDKAKTPEEAAENASQLAAISKAYNTLKDPRKRKEYDASLKGKPAPAPGPARPGNGMPGNAAAAGRTPAANEDVSPGATPVPVSAAEANSAAERQSMVHAQKKQMAQKAFVKGMQLFKRQELRQALSFFDVAVQNDPESEPQYHLKYAQCLMATKGSFTRAVEHAQLACDMDPYNLEFKLVHAEIHERAGVTSKAIEIYEEILRWDSGHTGAKNKLQLLKAQANSKQGVLDKITSLFSKKS